MRRHRVFEQQAVFGLLDGAELRADELHAVLLEHAAVGQLDREVQRGLSADGRQQREDAGRAARLQHLGFDADDLFQIGAGERLDVGAVGHLGVGHDGGRIGVGQHDLVAFGLERLAGLRAGVVELRRLADDDGPRADDEYLRDVVAAWHGLSLGSYCLFRANAVRTLRIVITSEARDLLSKGRAFRRDGFLFLKGRAFRHALEWAFEWL